MTAHEYIRTDTAEDAVSSLEVAAQFFDLSQTDPRYWKWFVVALHSGVQGFFVLALDGGRGSFFVQKPGVAAARLAAFEQKEFPPPQHMDNFLKLYKKLQRGENLRSTEVQPLPESQEQEEALQALDNLRDEFLHFNSKSWSIQVELVLSRVRPCIQMLQFLFSKSQSIVWHESDMEERAKASIEALHHRLS